MKIHHLAIAAALVLTSFTITASAADKTEVKPSELQNALTTQCEKHFPGTIQAEVRSACSAAAVDFPRIQKSLAQVRCRLNYGDEPRLVSACLVGAAISDEMLAGKETYKQKLQLCADSYPVHNEIDAFLKESCLTGVYAPELMNVAGRSSTEACASITPERSFIGPCAVGLTLAKETKDATSIASAAPPAKHNVACEQYFNHKQFHIAYRACMNARSLSTEADAKYADVIKGCSDITGEGNNDTERAACLVGVTIFRYNSKQDDLATQYKKCGDTKVTYEDRDVLACLTAASLLNFTNKGGAEAGCRDVFKDKKARTRNACVSSLSLF